jgi:isoprenylcysteine carboxyl methyltransferase (ICMT) family protein YpbQ
MALTTTAVAFLALLSAVGLSRLVELVISRRHQRRLQALGAVQFPDPGFPWMVLLHTGVLAGAAVEVVILHRPFVPLVGAVMLAVFLLAEGLRWWAISTLGRHWNVQVVNSTHLGVVSHGPFRIIRHPNYLAVFVGLTALPLIHLAWITALAGSIMHVWVLSRRIALEEKMLFASPQYQSLMADKPRFLPRLWRKTRRARVILSLTAVAVVARRDASGELVTVRYTEGIVHGFLALRTTEGKTLADGDLIQTARGSRVTARLVFRFRDGSLHDETAIFDQGRQFRLLTDHLVQKGPAFPRPLDMRINAATGEATVRYTDDHGQAKTESEHFDVTPDLANGLILTLLKNVRPDAPPKSFGFVAATPKPQLVKLALSVAGTERFSTGGAGRRATHYVLKVDIGGIKGLLAELFGKQPPDSHVWILGGEAPAFVKSEQPLFPGGPVWRIELVSPTWRRAQAPKP